MIAILNILSECVDPAATLTKSFYVFTNSPEKVQARIGMLHDNSLDVAAAILADQRVLSMSTFRLREWIDDNRHRFHAAAA
jgi:hypothetical protein